MNGGGQPRVPPSRSTPGLATCPSLHHPSLACVKVCERGGEQIGRGATAGTGMVPRGAVHCGRGSPPGRVRLAVEYAEYVQQDDVGSNQQSDREGGGRGTGAGDGAVESGVQGVRRSVAGVGPLAAKGRAEGEGGARVSVKLAHHHQRPLPSPSFAANRRSLEPRGVLAQRAASHRQAGQSSQARFRVLDTEQSERGSGLYSSTACRSRWPHST